MERLPPMPRDVEENYDHRAYRQGIAEQLARVWRGQLPFLNHSSPNIQDRRFVVSPSRGPWTFSDTNDPFNRDWRDIRRDRNRALGMQAHIGNLQSDYYTDRGVKPNIPIIPQEGSLEHQTGVGDLELQYLFQDLLQGREAHNRRVTHGMYEMGGDKVRRESDVTDEDIEAAK